MGGRAWSEEEELALTNLPLEEFLDQWGRSKAAAMSRREKLGLSNASGVLESGPRLPSRRMDAPLCKYCSTKKGECTCDEGDRCRDSLCVYGPTRSYGQAS